MSASPLPWGGGCLLRLRSTNRVCLVFPPLVLLGFLPLVKLTEAETLSCMSACCFMSEMFVLKMELVDIDFCRVSGIFFNIYFIFLAYFWDMFWILLGYVLDMFLILLGYVWDML